MEEPVRETRVPNIGQYLAIPELRISWLSEYRSLLTALSCGDGSHAAM
jgi:hypothetical protein